MSRLSRLYQKKIGSKYARSLVSDRVKDKKTVSSIAVFNQEGKLLFGLRNDDKSWSLPGGHAEEGEDPYHAAVRELKEETGIDATELEFLGDGYGGRENNVHVFSYKCTVDAEPTVGQDPDDECNIWSWVDVTDGIPEVVLKNLHNKKNVTLDLLELMEKKADVNIVDEPIEDREELSFPSTYPAGEELSVPNSYHPEDSQRHTDSSGDVDMGIHNAGGFGVNLTELDTGLGGTPEALLQDLHNVGENTQEDPDLKLGAVEAPYSSGFGDESVNFDKDQEENIVVGAGLKVEATVGNIVRMLGLDKATAEALHNTFPKADFAAAKIYKSWLASPSSPDRSLDAPEQVVHDFAEGFLAMDEVLMAISEHLMAGTPKFVQLINKMSNASTWTDYYDTAAHYMISNAKSNLTVANAVLTFPDGFYWVPLTGAECKIEGVLMQHCGRPQESMYSLRDSNNKPHVTIDVEPGLLLQVSGKQNDSPHPKYWPYIKSVVDALNIKQYLADDVWDADEGLVNNLGLSPLTLGRDEEEFDNHDEEDAIEDEDWTPGLNDFDEQLHHMSDLLGGDNTPNQEDEIKAEINKRLQALGWVAHTDGYRTASLSKRAQASGWMPAFKNNVSGEIVKSPGMHNINLLPTDYDDGWTDGFIDPKGNFFNREETAKKFNPKTKEKYFDSADLPPKLEDPASLARKREVEREWMRASRIKMADLVKDKDAVALSDEGINENKYSNGLIDRTDNSIDRSLDLDGPVHGK